MGVPTSLVSAECRSGSPFQSLAPQAHQEGAQARGGALSRRRAPRSQVPGSPAALSLSAAPSVIRGARVPVELLCLEYRASTHHTRSWPAVVSQVLVLSITCIRRLLYARHNAKDTARTAHAVCGLGGGTVLS